MRLSCGGALLVVVTALAVPDTVSAQSVSGAFTIDGRPFTPATVAAFRVRDRYAPRSTETYVMLTSKPVDREAIKVALDPYVAAINDKAVMEADFIALYVKPDGQVGANAHIGGTQYLDSSRSMMGQPPGLVATCPENTAARIACTVKSPKPIKTLDGPSWTLDVAFAADIDARPAGTALPADGGAAGKALLDLVAAVEAKDLAAILARLTPAEAAGYKEDWRSPAENLEAATDTLGFRLPKKPKVVAGERWAEDRAVLDVEGLAPSGVAMLYLVDMRLVKGQWVYSTSIALGMLR